MTEYEIQMLRIERAKVNTKIAEIARTLALPQDDAVKAFNGIYTNLSNKVWEK